MNISSLETIDLPNIGVIRGKLSDDALQVLKEEINKIQQDFSKAKPWNKDLAGHIRKEFLLQDSVKILEPMLINMALEHNEKYKYVDPTFDVELGKKYRFAMETMWVNFQQKHEFNPLHRHTGIYSFVIWVEIPYFLNFEKEIGPGKNANVNRAGMFEFTYTDILGNLRGESIGVDKSYEGCIIMFPARLHHMVHPFYSTENYRISVAGNIKVITE
jgi:hypothetical protein